MRPLVVIQARISSTRLPGKSLLPIGGYPLAVLVALRALKSRNGVIVATSTDPSDDPLSAELSKADVQVFRGPLKDVLRRFADATSNLPEEGVIVRLTADNVFPDGEFVEELIARFESSGMDYLGGDAPQNRMPCGLKGEVFRAADLRRAASFAVEPYDREHVTPWIIRNRRCGVFIPKAIGANDFGHLRCTIDTREDYVSVASLFEPVEDPIGIGWHDLLHRLAERDRAAQVQH